MEILSNEDKIITEKYFAKYKAQNWHDITYEFIWIFELLLTSYHTVIQLRNVFLIGNTTRVADLISFKSFKQEGN